MSLWSQYPWVNTEFVAPLLQISASPQQPGASPEGAPVLIELLDKMCEQSDNSAQISDRLERFLTSMEAQSNDRTAWAGWMSSAMGKIHKDLWTNYQMRSMDHLNQTLKESKLLAERDVQRQDLDTRTSSWTTGRSNWTACSSR